jgi:hypothetical protein
MELTTLKNSGSPTGLVLSEAWDHPLPLFLPKSPFRIDYGPRIIKF